MNINIVPNGAIKRVHVSQNDIGRTLTFNLFNDSLAYTVPVGATVKIQGTKPSGFGFSETCTVSGNTVTVDTTEAMTDEFGYIEAELQITNSGDVIGTSNFILAIEKNPHPDNTTDGTQITAQSLEVRIEALEESALGGLTDEAKQALLNCFAHVAWIDEHGQDYYDALEDALYPPVTLVSISAVYTQGGTVYDTDSLDSLKSDLVVTAHYDDSSTQTVTTYTLSGTLTVGTSTITVSYGGKTTTFTVAVTETPTLSSISAVYTQSGTVYETDSLDSLKADLVVTAHYSDSSTRTVTDYTLSGTLEVGTSTITVSYGGQTTTFEVTVNEYGVLYSLYNATFDGTSASNIDTTLDLFTTNISFTIAMDVYVGTQTNYEGGNNIATIFGVGGTGGSNNGFYVDYLNGFGRMYFGTNYAPLPVASNRINITNQNVKFIITHTADTNSYHYRMQIGADDTVYNSSVTKGFISDSRPLRIGYGQNDQDETYDTRHFVGTMNKFIVYDYVLSNEQISAFFE